MNSEEVLCPRVLLNILYISLAPLSIVCPRVLLNILYISLAPLSIVDTRSCAIPEVQICQNEKTGS